MANVRVVCWKGPDEAKDKGIFNLDSDSNLATVRTSLLSQDFITADNDDQAFRFVEKETTSEQNGNPVINPDDAVIGISTEHYVPLGDVLRPGNRLILTNLRRKVPDIMGIRTNWLFSRNRNLGIQVSLNNSDPEAFKTNQRIQARDPLLYAECKPTDVNRAFPYQRICVLINQSVVNFTLSSWGGAGYEMQIESFGEPAEWICNGGLYIPMRSPGRAQCGLSRYYSQPRTIQIRSAADTNIVGADIVNFQRVTFRTRRITSWRGLDGSSYSNNDPVPPSLPPTRDARDSANARELALANAPRAADIDVIPGGSIIPGGPTMGPPSSEQFGGIASVQCDRDWSSPIGEVPIYFFVFRSLEAARVVIDGYNGFDPDQWVNP